MLDAAPRGYVFQRIQHSAWCLFSHEVGNPFRYDSENVGREEGKRKRRKKEKEKKKRKEKKGKGREERREK